MAFEFLAIIFKNIGTSFISIIGFIMNIEFFFGKNIGPMIKLFRIIGFIAFFAIIMQAVGQAADKTQQPLDSSIKEIITYVGRLILSTLGEFGSIFISVDNSIYTTSKEFSDITNPTVWDALKTAWTVLTRSFFYFWWFRIINMALTSIGILGIDKSTPDAKIFGYTILVLTIFIIITNIGGMIYNKQITFDNVPGNMAQKTAFFFKNNFDNAFEFVLIFIPFKGMFHYLIFNLGKTIILLASIFGINTIPEKQIIIQNITNTTG